MCNPDIHNKLSELWCIDDIRFYANNNACIVTCKGHQVFTYKGFEVDDINTSMITLEKINGDWVCVRCMLSEGAKPADSVPQNEYYLPDNTVPAADEVPGSQLQGRGSVPSANHGKVDKLSVSLHNSRLLGGDQRSVSMSSQGRVDSIWDVMSASCCWATGAAVAPS